MRQTLKPFDSLSSRRDAHAIFRGDQVMEFDGVLSRAGWPSYTFAPIVVAIVLAWPTFKLNVVRWPAIAPVDVSTLVAIAADRLAV